MTIKKTYTSTPESADYTPPPLPVPIPPNCVVETLPDQSVIITLRVDAATMKRHKSRANGMDLSKYMWDNILHRALVDSVY